jgi:signal peptidase I
MSGFSRGYKRSFADQKRERVKVRRLVLSVALVSALFLVLTRFIFSMFVIENTSMEPGLLKGDRFVFLSFNIYHTLSNIPLFETLPVKRGHIVLLDFTEKRRLSAGVLTALTRFFTAGRFTPPGMAERLFIKRVIALPGDEVTITNYVARVRPADAPYTYTEYECSDEIYYNHFPENNEMWDESLPLSGNMEAVTLGKDEYFVLSDDRSNTNDSRTWGPVPVKAVRAKTLLRYWPFPRFGFP